MSELTGPEEIAAIETEKLTQLLRKTSKNRLGENKAAALKSLAENSVGIGWASEAFNIQIRMLLQQIELLEKQVKTLEINIGEIYRQQQVQLTTIPGVGINLAATILAEIGDINRFAKDRGR